MSDVARLAGETLCVGVPDVTLDARTREAVAALAPGAFVLFARNVSTLDGTRELVAALRAAAGGEAPALVCVDQEGGRVAARRRGEQRRADAAAPTFGTHRHAPDLHRRGIEHVKTSRAEHGGIRHAVDGERVNRAAIGAIVLVDFFFGRNALFVNEDRRANRERRAHPSRIRYVEQLNDHDRLRPLRRRRTRTLSRTRARRDRGCGRRARRQR
ncbi:MAG: hypothetical protein NVS3B16_21110 [Vulcanimicrobiaceae bacterium]